MAGSDGAGWISRLSSARSRRWLKRGLIGLVGLWLVTWLAVPPIVKHVLATQVAAALHRPVSVDAVGFTPWRLALRFDGLRIGRRAADGDLLRIAHGEINLSSTSLPRRALVLDSLTLEQPALLLHRDAAGQLDIADLLQGDEAAPATPATAAAEPFHYLLANVRVHDGRIDVVDDSVGVSHRLEQVEIGLPFLANLASAAQIEVEPLLAFRIDGQPQRFEGHTLPFDPSHASHLELHFNQLALTPYLAYAAGALPVKVKEALLSGALDLEFAAAPVLKLGLKGMLVLDRVDLSDREDRALLTLDHGEIAILDLQPIAGQGHLARVQAEGLKVDLWPAPPVAPQAAAAPEAKAPFALTIDSLRLADGALQLHADPVERGSVEIGTLRLEASHLATTGTAPANVELHAAVAGGTIAAKGTLGLATKQVRVDAELAGIDLARLAPLLPFDPAVMTIGGSLGGKGKLGVDYGEAFDLDLGDFDIDLGHLALEADKKTPLAIDRIAAHIDALDLAKATAALATLEVGKLVWTSTREKEGDYDIERLLARALPKPDPKAPKGPDWSVQVGKLGLTESALHLTDLTSPKPIKLDVEPFELTLEHAGTDPAQQLGFAIGGGFNRKGRFSFAGTLLPKDVTGDIRIDTDGLDLSAFEPYVTTSLNARILSALLTAKGRLQLRNDAQGRRVNFSGDATLARVRLLDKLSDDDFVHWAALSASRIEVDLPKAKPPRIDIGAIALSGFYARMIVTADGKLNLTDVLRSEDQAATSLTRVEGVTPGEAPAPNLSAKPKDKPVASTSTAPATPPPELRFGQVILQGGRINYTDLFIKPNFTANLTDIGGKVGAFGSVDPTPAEINLAGKLDTTAPITISGKLNPVAPRAFIDLSAKAEGVELTHLTAYATKYAGYPIDKGLLNVDLHYRLNDGKLSADNHLFIDQLTFGDHVDSETATKLPVTLAVALLKNARGEIDVNIPVSGSLDDPQFSLGGVVFKAFMNVIISAATSPFRLLGSLFGSDEELSFVEFDPGRSALTPTATQRLESLGKALTDRPGLKLDISGRVDPETDTPGLREVRLAERIEAARRKDTAGKGGDADHPDEAQAPLDPSSEDYAKYLEVVYKSADFPKPKNALGFTKGLPPDEMTKLLLANISITDADLEALADRRAEAVREALSATISPSRLFIEPSKSGREDLKDEGKASRVDLGLK